MGFSLYGDWLVAPFVSAVVSPDLTKRRRLDVRVGASWYPTTQPGTAGLVELLRLEAEATARTMIPGQHPGHLAEPRRGPVAARRADLVRLAAARRASSWSGSSTSPRQHGRLLTPFANAEVIWSTSQDMWAQFRMQAGLQLGVDWFGKGQVIEVNGSVITYLQPSRSYSPVVGVVWYQYF